MKSFGVILFLVGLALIIWMFFMGNDTINTDIVYSSSTLKSKLFFASNKQLFALLGSTLAICGTLMAIFCEGSADELKMCKSCNETIDIKAKKCKHCHEWVEGAK